mmetsp:Transcript_39502/g.75661  ORF Transcript_39502/g.75661 Transcript_39502/m.75661 type:complete len:540 (+) Transcript_39502:1-1620(+)
MVASGVEICVAEALPGAQSTEALSGIEFEMGLDLGSSSSGGSSSNNSAARYANVAQILQQTQECCLITTQQYPAYAEVESEGKATILHRFSLLPTSLEEDSLLEGKSAEKQVAQHLQRLGFREVPKQDLQSVLQTIVGMQFPPHYICTQVESERKRLKKIPIKELRGLRGELDLDAIEGEKKPELIQRILACIEQSEIEAEQNLSAPAGVMQGKVLRSSSVGKMKLALITQSCGQVEVDLPILGISGANAALAAACMGLEMFRRDGLPLSQATLNILHDALQLATPPPGTLELLTAAGTDDPRAFAVLHETTSLDEVVRALRVVREWRSIDGHCLPLTVVIGCEGELRRGDRTKLGWALAELCDRVVLTSNHPRAEPPMQILEDVLEAIRGRVPRHLGLADVLPLAREVHIVADRTDAIKLAISSSTRQLTSQDPGVVLIFGSAHVDTQQAADVDGNVRHWLLHDRRIALEALEVTKRMCDNFGPEASTDNILDMSQMPWSMGKHPKSEFTKFVTLPGQSLHWTYDIHMSSKGETQEPL